MTTSPLRLIALTLLALGAGRSVATAQSAPLAPPTPQNRTESYIVAVQDVLNITVWDNPELTGKVTVQPDGTVTLPLIGRLVAAGVTVQKFELLLTRALADGFILDPRVAVTLDQYRGRRVFVFGDVSAPGTYPFADGLTLIEVLAKAGGGAASEAVIVRPKHPSGPILPDMAGDAQVLRVNVRELEKDVQHGSLARNAVLEDGDTVFVPRVDPTRVFVSGEVRKPGAYSITQGTTVLQALTLAGGISEDGAVNRIRLIRFVGGKQRTLKARLSDVLTPGDTIVVPERFF
jgi:polysaccharide biosynthesis/export protein